MAHSRLLIAAFLPWALLLWGFLFVPQAYASSLAVRDLSGLSGTSDLPFRLFKRRRGGDGDSSGGSSGGGSSSGSGDDDDDDDDDSTSSSGGSSGCVSVESCLRSRYGYGKYYSSGPGSAGSTEGGYTPDGSGETPRWLYNDVDKWEFQWGFEHKERARLGEGWYYGGAEVPYLAGETSPGGIEPERINLNNPGKGDSSNNSAITASATNSPLCEFTPDMYGYKYPRLYNLSYESPHLPFDDLWEMVPVYCACQTGSLCACDDPVPAYNFTEVVMRDVFGAYNLNFNGGNRIPNATKGCDVFIDGEHRILINGTVRDGSTKADPDMERTNLTGASTCTDTCASDVSDALATTVPLSFVWMAGLLAGLAFM